MELLRLLPLCLLFGFCPAQAQQVDEIDLTSGDVLSLMNANAWGFSYKPKIATKSLHLLVYEELTDEKGRTTTSIRKAMWMGMRPNPDRVFKIKMVLKGRELNSRISAGGGPPINLSEHFVDGTYEYRRGAPHKPDADGRRFLMEIGNKKLYKGKPPFKLVLKFKVFENCTNATIQAIINGEIGA